jgi:hypothetical protein
MMLGLLAVAGCNPYHNLGGDFYLDPVDATNFSPAYLGAGFSSEQTPGTISSLPSIAAGGVEIDFYAFPAVAGNDPTLIDDGSGRQLAYIFDGDASQDTSKCTPPNAHYLYDAQRDFVRFDRQGNVFEDEGAVLPDDPSYEPVYAQVDATSNGEGCNTVHSAEGLVKNHNVTVKLGTDSVESGDHALGVPDGKYLALAAIDPRAFVTFPDGTVNDSNGIGPQRFGWYNHYLLAYMEGGAIPVDMITTPDPAGGPDTTSMVARTATIYIPNDLIDSMGNETTCNLAAPAPCVVTDSTGAQTACASSAPAPCIDLAIDGTPVALMVGADGGSPARGDAGYSPICSVRTFTPDDPTAPPTDPGDGSQLNLDDDAGVFVYCFQVVGQ